MAIPSIELVPRKIFFFGNTEAHLVRHLPKAQKKFVIYDRWGRTTEDLKFIRAFERIFRAASTGDLKTCQAIVEKEKFTGIDDYSVGVYADAEDNTLDRVSPRQLAEKGGHKHITAYFLLQFGPPSQFFSKMEQSLVLDEKNSSSESGHNSKSKARSTVAQESPSRTGTISISIPEFKTSEDEETYGNCKRTYREMAQETDKRSFVLNMMRTRIVNTFPPQKSKDVSFCLGQMREQALFEIFKERCNYLHSTQSYEELDSIEFFALWDGLVESNFFSTSQGSASHQKSQLIPSADVAAEKTAMPQESYCVLLGSDCPLNLAALDNDYLVSFEHGGLHYSSVTACYEAQKFSRHPQLMLKFPKLNPAEAVRFTADNHTKIHRNWTKRRIEAMWHVLCAKFGQNPSLKSFLLSTADNYLSYCFANTDDDFFWVDTADGLGTNVLGKLLMLVRGAYGGCGKVPKPENYEEQIVEKGN